MVKRREHMPNMQVVAGEGQKDEDGVKSVVLITKCQLKVYNS